MKSFLARVPILVWFLVPSIVLIAVGVWFLSKGSGQPAEDSPNPAAVSKPVLGTQEFAIVGREHIPAGTSGTGYNSNPPASGPHWANPAKNGVYDKPLADEQIIHDLEHGYVWISFQSGISQEVKDKLREIVEKDDWKIILAPRDKNDAKIALVAWGRLLTLDEPDYDKIRDFIKTYRNRGPEKTPD